MAYLPKKKAHPSCGPALRDQEFGLHQDIDAVGVRLVLRPLQPRDPAIHLVLGRRKSNHLQVGTHAKGAIPSPGEVIAA